MFYDPLIKESDKSFIKKKQVNEDIKKMVEKYEPNLKIREQPVTFDSLAGKIKHLIL